MKAKKNSKKGGRGKNFSQKVSPPESFLGHLRSLALWATRVHPLLLALGYVAVYVLLELLVQNPIRLYIYNVLLAMSGIYFAWFLGGKRAMGYVAFFNIFIVFIFSKMLWSHGVVVSWRVFFARTFLVMYVVAAVLLFMMLRRQSPADKHQQAQKDAVELERSRRQNLEFMVASRKLKHDLLAQANLVKDELQLLEGAWRSNIHDIINDLPTVKERELHQQIILPFQNNIIGHLRELEHKLTFDVQPLVLSELLDFVREKLRESGERGGLARLARLADQGWEGSKGVVLVDKNKVWDILLNVLRNSQAALDLRRLGLLREGRAREFAAQIEMRFELEEHAACVRIADNAGGVDRETERKLYREPVLSTKRRGKSAGQGSLFVKFFADRMGMAVSAANVERFEAPGLEVLLSIPLLDPAEVSTAGSLRLKEGSPPHED